MSPASPEDSHKRNDSVEVGREVCFQCLQIELEALELRKGREGGGDPAASEMGVCLWKHKTL